MTELLLLIIPVSVLTQKGFWLVRCTWWEMALFAGAIIAIFPTELWTFPVAVGLETLGVVLHVIRFRKLTGKKQAEVAASAA